MTEGADRLWLVVLTLAPRSRSAFIAPRTVVGLVVAGEETCGSLVETLESNRFEVEIHRLGSGSFRFNVGATKPAAIIIALCGARGANLLAATICRQVRETDVLIPILCVAGPASAGSRSQVLEAGADDLITLPLDEIEFLARLGAHVRKARTVASILADQPLADGRNRWFGEIEIDVRAREVRVAGQPLQLDRLEFNLVEYLSRNAGTACSWEQITNELHGFDAEILADRIELLVRSVRAKLGSGAGRSEYLLAAPGYGFRWQRSSPQLTLMEASNQ